MNDKEKQYADRTKYGKVSRYEAKGLDLDLPEWIINLKNYFEKDAAQKNFYSHD